MVRDFRYIGLNRVGVPVQMIKEIEDQEKLEKEQKEKEFEEKVDMPRKTKGILNRLVKPPHFKTKVANFYQQISNRETDTIIYRKKNY